MKSNTLAPHKKPAQAMVEFALVLPMLLLLLYGLLEVGRLLFMYSTIVTASRQAVRYGSATGLGTGTTTVARYKDCLGIRQAANRVDYLNAFDHLSDDVKIFYDNGPSAADETDDIPICGVGDSDEDWPASNDTRLIVKVRGHFNALVKLVPLPTRTIEATSRRTVLISVPIEVTVPAPASAAATTTQIIDTIPNPSQPGQQVTLHVSVTSASGTPVGTVVVTDAAANPVCTITLNPATGLGECYPSFLVDTMLYAAYIPSDPAVFAPSQFTAGYLHDVDVMINTVTQIIEDLPDYSLLGQDVTIVVWVKNEYGGSPPTGSVDISVCGTQPLDPATGRASCVVSFNSLGIINITATYSGDAEHNGSSDLSEEHEVLGGTATASNTPPPTPTFTETPIPTATPVPTNTPTMTPTLATVPNCNTIAGAFSDSTDKSPIDVSLYTMYLDIPNTTGYPVTIGTVWLSWNNDAGHDLPPKGPGSAELRLQSADLNGVVFWTGDLYASSYEISNVAVVIPPGGGRLTFTFDQTYDNPDQEAIHLTFISPGCVEYPLFVSNKK